MPEVERRVRGTASATVMAAIASVLLSLASWLLLPATAIAQPAYTYSSFHTEIDIGADGSLLVHNKVTYDFSDPTGWVGIFVPSSYGKVVESRVLAADGSELPEYSWDYEDTSDGYTIWCDSSGAGSSATYVFEYLLHDALEFSDDSAGFSEWSAVPVQRSSPIDETSFTLRFPSTLDTSLVELEVHPSDYSGQITKRFVGGRTAIIEADYLDVSSSYSVSCYWPAAIMDLSGPADAMQADKIWEFERFDTEFTLNEDSSFTVRETQVVNFQGSFSFLNRDILAEPPAFEDGRTYGKVRIRDIAVYDLAGEPYQSSLWNAESHDWGKRVHIEFDALDEQMGWIVEYRITGGLIFAQDYDRLYWQPFTYDREAPIRSSLVTVHLPQEADPSEVRATQYVSIDNPPGSYDSGREGGVLWWRVEEIPPYSDFSIDVALPKGIVAKPWQYDSTFGIAIIAASSAIFAAALIFMLALWWKHGRDKGRTGTTMVRYEPPQGLTPAMVGMLVNQKPRVQDISATIVDLARRGYLTIIEEEERKYIRIRKYAFQRARDDLSELLPYEREIMNGLFESGDRVDESDLKNSFYTHMDSILKGGVSEEVMKRGLFTREPRRLRRIYLTAGALVAAVPPVAGLFLTRWFDLGWFAVLLLSFVPAGLVVAVVGWAMPSRSREGSRAYEHVLGFKDYLETAEKQELDYMTPETFQANLPYAMVLEVADAWARKFREIYTTPPQWYSGTSTTFNTLYLTASLSDMTGNLSRTLTSSPSSSGSGGGGGFGGGSSGGGGGGGGSSAG